MPEPDSVSRRRLNANRLNRDTYCTFVGARISHKQREHLEEAAAKADDSVSEIIREAIERHLKSIRRRKTLPRDGRQDE